LLGKAMDSSALPMTLIYGENGRLVYSLHIQFKRLFHLPML
jgi:hypothetical protein